jgi:hypothetical protein
MTMRNIRHAAPELRPNADVDMVTVRPTTHSDIYSLGILFLQVRQYLLPGQTEQSVMLFPLVAFSWA